MAGDLEVKDRMLKKKNTYIEKLLRARDRLSKFSKHKSVSLSRSVSIIFARAEIQKQLANVTKQSSVFFAKLIKSIRNLTILLKKHFFTVFSNSPEKFARFKYYFKIWLIMSRNSFLIVLSKKLLLVMFLSGKIMRFGFFIFFLIYAVRGAGGLAGYSVEQTIFFFLTFSIIDIVNQFLFREVYRFRNLVTSGDLDLVMVKPMNPLFRSLMGGADVIDLVTIPPVIASIFYVGSRLSPQPTDLILYLLLVVNGILIGAAFHIAVLALGILTYEVDHTILIYRDLTSLGRLPIDVYSPVIRTLLTYFLPVAVMVTVPTKVLFGLVSPLGILFAFGLGILVLILSTRLWNMALRKYSSASS